MKKRRLFSVYSKNLSTTGFLRVFHRLLRNGSGGGQEEWYIMKKFMKIAGISAAAVAVLLLAAYFVIGSSWFFKGQILPRVSAAIGAPVTTETVAFSPFSSLEMTGLRVGDPARPLAEVKTLRIRYSALAAVFGKKISVSELSVDGASVRLEQKADGSWNLPQPPASGKSAAPTAAGSSKAPGSAYALDIRNVRITDASFKLEQKTPMPATAELAGINLFVPAVRAGEPLDLAFSALATAARNGELLADRMPVTAILTLESGLELGRLPAGLNLQLRAGEAHHQHDRQ
jgi:hypothetical protein